MVLPKGTWTVFKHSAEQHIGVIDDNTSTGEDEQEVASTLDATPELLVWPGERWVVEILSMHQIADGASTLCEERSGLRQGYSQTHEQEQIT